MAYNGLINKTKGRRQKASNMKVTKNILSRQLNESEYEELIRLRAENEVKKRACLERRKRSCTSQGEKAVISETLRK